MPRSHASRLSFAAVATAALAAVLAASCVSVPDGPEKMCDTTADCDHAHGEVCGEGVCWGNPPGMLAAVLSAPSERADLVSREVKLLPITQDGWIDDMLAFTKPWGFDVGDIRVPVVLTYGRTDVLVPSAHGDWLLAHIPGAEAWVDDEAGHMGDDSTVERDMAWLGQPDPG